MKKKNNGKGKKRQKKTIPENPLIEFNDWLKARKYNFSIDTQSDLDFVQSLAKSAPIETMTFSEIWKTLV